MDIDDAEGLELCHGKIRRGQLGQMVALQSKNGNLQGGTSFGV